MADTPNPVDATVSTASAQALALARFLETTIIVLIPGVILAALGAFQLQLSCTSAPATAAGCAFRWEPIVLAAVTALIAGLTNSLTAFIGKTHQIATTSSETAAAIAALPTRGTTVAVVPVEQSPPSPMPHLVSPG